MSDDRDDPRLAWAQEMMDEHRALLVKYFEVARLEGATLREFRSAIVAQAVAMVADLVGSRGPAVMMEVLQQYLDETHPGWRGQA
jgi:hypothetical protein